MPRLDKVIQSAELRSKSSIGASYDTAAYREIIRTASTGVGGVVALAPDENRRAEKRRLSVAAKELGHRLKWRKAADADTLRFVLNGADDRQRARPRIVDTERELVAV